MALDLARLARMQALLDELGPLDGLLLPNEREMVRHLRARIDDPGHTQFDDVHALEVIRRNVRVRQGFDFDAARDPPRVINVKPKRPGG
ncbi:MAG: hypothetical protein ACREER_03830 [Alphaproteobacteria bacterium]